MSYVKPEDVLVYKLDEPLDIDRIKSHQEELNKILDTLNKSK